MDKAARIGIAVSRNLVAPRAVAPSGHHRSALLPPLAVGGEFYPTHETKICYTCVFGFQGHRRADRSMCDPGSRKVCYAVRGATKLSIGSLAEEF